VNAAADDQVDEVRARSVPHLAVVAAGDLSAGRTATRCPGGARPSPWLGFALLWASFAFGLAHLRVPARGCSRRNRRCDKEFVATRDHDTHHANRATETRPEIGHGRPLSGIRFLTAASGPTS
jgi:hypothetical protein